MHWATAIALVVWLVTPAGAAPAPASAPISPPAATRPADMEPLLDGSIRYLPPPGWKLVSKTDNNLQAIYASPDETGRIDINVSPQTREVPASFAQQMARLIGKGIREDADRQSHELKMQPRVEKDERFFLRIHDISLGAGGTVDRVQLYRVMGLNIVHVAVVARTDSPEEAKPIHAVGETLLETMRLSRGPQRLVFPRSQLKIVSPIDWDEVKADQPNGLVVTYNDPKDPLRKIIVRAHVLPKEARTAGPQQTAHLDRMVDAERRETPFTSPPPEEQVISSGDYLRQLRVILPGAETNLAVETRYLAVGESLVSVRSIAAEGDAEIAAIAAKLASGITTIR